MGNVNLYKFWRLGGFYFFINGDFLKGTVVFDFFELIQYIQLSVGNIKVVKNINNKIFGCFFEQFKVGLYGFFYVVFLGF